MSFRIKVLMGFLLWHAVITSWGLIKGTLDYAEPTNDQCWMIEGVWRTSWMVTSLILSLLGVVLAYLCRALVVLGRQKLGQ